MPVTEVAGSDRKVCCYEGEALGIVQPSAAQSGIVAAARHRQHMPVLCSLLYLPLSLCLLPSAFPSRCRSSSSFLLLSLSPFFPLYTSSPLVFSPSSFFSPSPRLLWLPRASRMRMQLNVRAGARVCLSSPRGHPLGGFTGFRGQMRCKSIKKAVPDVRARCCGGASMSFRRS